MPATLPPLNKMPLFGAMMVLPVLSAAALADGGSGWHHKDGVAAEHWSDHHPEYALCDAGTTQSPIDLSAANATGTIRVAPHFRASAGHVALASEKVQFDLDPGQQEGVEAGERRLVQVHFHSPSEHAIGGKRFPLEAHFVHKGPDGSLAVLGVMLREGRSNPAIAAMLAGAAKGNGSAARVDLARLVPGDLSVYRYMGSLTTPPCTEGVNWYVARTPVEAAPAEIAALAKALGPTARSLQPVGQRLVVAPGR